MSRKEINASIMTIGDELLIGQTVDTNSAFIGTELNKAGIWVRKRIAVGDVTEDILQTLEALSRESSIVIITGGLGPTADDITKPALCTYFQSRMIVNEAVEQHVKGIFERLKRPMLAVNLKQAEVPHNCTVLPNLRGTAPGMWFEKEGVVYISLPGVPHEMAGLIVNEVLPRLKSHFQLPFIRHRTMLLAGKGESEISEGIKDLEAALPSHVKLAYLPSYGMVKLRLTGRSDEEASLEQTLEQHFVQLKERVREWLVAEEDITLQEAVSRLLLQRKKTLATAESCTGGFIAHLITAKAGSSAIYKGSVVSYANEIKEDLLNVSPETLQTFGAVSEGTVVQMAEAVRQRMGTDYAIATSGIMGPTGGSDEKPVGMVWIAVASERKTEASVYQFRFDRERNIELTARAALNQLRKRILEED